MWSALALRHQPPEKFPNQVCGNIVPSRSFQRARTNRSAGSRIRCHRALTLPSVTLLLSSLLADPHGAYSDPPADSHADSAPTSRLMKVSSSLKRSTLPSTDALAISLSQRFSCYHPAPSHLRASTRHHRPAVPCTSCPMHHRKPSFCTCCYRRLAPSSRAPRSRSICSLHRCVIARCRCRHCRPLCRHSLPLRSAPSHAPRPSSAPSLLHPFVPLIAPSLLQGRYSTPTDSARWPPRPPPALPPPLRARRQPLDHAVACPRHTGPVP